MRGRRDLMASAGKTAKSKTKSSKSVQLPDKTASSNKTGSGTSLIPSGIDRSRVIFSLDIGTRSVVGILGYRDSDEYVVIDHEQCHHRANAMRDGQIEDIELVSLSVKQVRETLEKRNGLRFKKVAIAAAGRALRTVSETYSIELGDEDEITRSMVESYEYSVVSKAQQTFAAKNLKLGEEFFCVGYSILSYKLDGYAYANLEGHKGKLVEVEAIAAFLPNHVVESLYAVTAKNKLEVDFLTLEPIAAVNIIVPRDIRLLNIAIIDIGAGTSDIAISKNGSIAAYGMATIAGDEISEAIMKKFLLGFEMAEKVKIEWSNGVEEIIAEDIFADPVSIKPEDIETTAAPVIELLAKTVARDIIKINGGAPMAVFLVGGGSQTPGLCAQIAAQLKMPEDRVAVGGKKPFKMIRLPDSRLANPEYVTPIGIGTAYAMNKGCNFFSITVNGVNVMAVSNGITRVMDALLLTGIKPSKLIGYSSSALKYSVNGESFSERGKPAQPGSLLLNGQPATIQDVIKAGDSITVISAVDGVTPAPTIGEITEQIPDCVFIIGGQETQVKNIAVIRGRRMRPDYIVRSGDAVETMAPRNIRDVYFSLGMNLPRSVIYLINGAESVSASAVKPGDSIDVLPRPIASRAKAKPAENAKTDKKKKNKTKTSPKQTKFKTAKAKKQTAKPEVEKTADLEINTVAQTEPAVQTAAGDVSAAAKQREPGVSSVNINGNWTEVKASKGYGLMFVDMLNHVDVNLEQPQGILRMRLNGRDASYVDNVSDGDTVEIFWEQK